MCVCVCVVTYVRVCTWRPEDSLGYCSSGAVHLVFLLKCVCVQVNHTYIWRSEDNTMESALHFYLSLKGISGNPGTRTWVTRFIQQALLFPEPMRQDFLLPCNSPSSLDWPVSEPQGPSAPITPVLGVPVHAAIWLQLCCHPPLVVRFKPLGISTCTFQSH